MILIVSKITLLFNRKDYQGNLGISLLYWYRWLIKKRVSMSQDYKQKILNWLEQKWPKNKRNCEICSGTQWSISEDIIAPLIVENNNLNIGSKTYPQIMGYLLFLC